MATLTVPSASTVTRRPLSTHGLPKQPRIMSPEFPHHCSTLNFPSPSTISGFTSPGSPGPMSPPVSAKSFGTFIDSEPSTPAYSPRMDYDWDDATIVMLRPMSSSSEPSSPTEPAWDMIRPTMKPQQAIGAPALTKKEPSAVPRETFGGTRLVLPPKKVKTSQKALPVKDVNIVDIAQKAPRSPHLGNDEEGKTPAEQSTENNTASFVKLASKVKLMLRRRSTTTEKKKEKKEKDYYDPEEDLHWTER